MRPTRFGSVSFCRRFPWGDTGSTTSDSGCRISSQATVGWWAVGRMRVGPLHSTPLVGWLLCWPFDWSFGRSIAWSVCLLTGCRSVQKRHGRFRLVCLFWDIDRSCRTCRSLTSVRNAIISTVQRLKRFRLSYLCFCWQQVCLSDRARCCEPVGLAGHVFNNSVVSFAATFSLAKPCRGHLYGYNNLWKNRFRSIWVRCLNSRKPSVG